METLFSFVTPRAPCSYLPDRYSQTRYDVVGRISLPEYQARMDAGWRRFGFSLFKPECEACRECQSIRVDPVRFKPSDSQKRAAKANRDVTITVAEPEVRDETLRLYEKFHSFQAGFKGWPEKGPKDPDDFAESFVINPFPTEEWRYTVADKLVAVGYVDALPAGLSAIYFFYDPDCRDRSLGTFNVMKVIHATARRKLPWTYLGYFVDGCRSLEYKGKFRPNQVLRGGEWVAFRD